MRLKKVVIRLVVLIGLSSVAFSQAVTLEQADPDTSVDFLNGTKGVMGHYVSSWLESGHAKKFSDFYTFHTPLRPGFVVLGSQIYGTGDRAFPVVGDVPAYAKDHAPYLQTVFPANVIRPTPFGQVMLILRDERHVIWAANFQGHDEVDQKTTRNFGTTKIHIDVIYMPAPKTVALMGK